MRVVIYTRGECADADHQRDHCYRMAAELGYIVAAVASDRPGEVAGWISVNKMIEDGDADRILVVSRTIYPPVIESVTGQLQDRRPRRLNH